jgi:hypothetical protein
MKTGTASFEEKKKRQTVKMKKLMRFVIPWELGVLFGFDEHGGHHETHYGEDDESWEEKLRRAMDVLEVPAHEYESLGEEWIRELWAQMFVRHGVLRSIIRGEIVVFIDGVVTAMRCRRPR